MALQLTLCTIERVGPPGKCDLSYEEVKGFDSIRRPGDREFWATLLKAGVVFPENGSDTLVARPKDFGEARKQVGEVSECTQRHKDILDEMERNEGVWLWVMD